MEVKEAPNKLLSLDNLFDYIESPSEFLCKNDIDSLKTFLDLEYSPSVFNQIPEYASIRQHVLNKIVKKPVKGSDLLEEFKKSTTVMTTGCEPFDEIFKSDSHPLGSYLHWGDVVEICGNTNVGKTHLIQQILITEFYDNAYYIDTRMKFSATKLQIMMNDLGFSDSKIEKILKKIEVYRVNDLDVLYSSLYQINKKQNPNLKKIVIIDSISVPVGLFMGDSQLINSQLTDIMHEINELSRCNSTFLITNLASYIEYDQRLDGDWKPFCGNFWASFADHKVLVDEDGDCELLKSRHFSVEEEEECSAVESIDSS